jgi:cysteine desulfurase
VDSIYFDNASTTRIDDRVMEKMIPFFTEEFGNANSAHQLGRNTKVAIEDARESIASLIGAEPSEIIFTSGGTESDNAALKGVVAATRKKEIITSPVEHHAVIHPAESLKMNGVRITYLQPDNTGMIHPEQVAEAISGDTAIVSLMHVNNELGTINPIQEIADVCRERNVPFHSDTVQSAGKIPLNVKEIGLSALSISAHKIYGPKGIGVLYVKNGTPWLPWLQGGSQERRRRGGTSNVPGIVGLAESLKISTNEMNENFRHCTHLRELALQEVKVRLGDRVTINGPEINGVPNILNLGFISDGQHGLDGEMLLLNLDIEGVCVSNGSACTSGAMEPSHVLLGIGITENVARSSIRISFGKYNTEKEVIYFAEKLEGILERMVATTI